MGKREAGGRKMLPLPLASAVDLRLPALAAACLPACLPLQPLIWLVCFSAGSLPCPLMAWPS